jgi:hypothetical protein
MEFFDGKTDYQYRELVNGLVPNPRLPQERMIKGCQVLMPDTVFFNNEGLAEMVVSNDKEYCMANDQKIKLSKEMHTIKVRLEDLYKERKRDNLLYGNALRASELNNPGTTGQGNKAKKLAGKKGPSYMDKLSKNKTDGTGEEDKDGRKAGE